MFTAHQIANQFLLLAAAEGRSVTPLQLIKLVYFAQGWNLAFRKRALVSESIEAWKYGPVIPALYRDVRDFKDQPIPGLLRDSRTGRTDFPLLPDSPEGDEARALVQEVWSKYKKFNGVQLSVISHRSDSPWSVVTRAGQDARNQVISDVEIERHFSQTLTEAKQAEHGAASAM
ncbi:MAG: DUF4065 domain-containing protein [Fimbriimonadaceae bacterium]|nr:DUF4065 domain-containing protein [Fimbriimonadaceae bacterium]